MSKRKENKRKEDAEKVERQASTAAEQNSEEKTTGDTAVPAEESSNSSPSAGSDSVDSRSEEKNPEGEYAQEKGSGGEEDEKAKLKAQVEDLQARYMRAKAEQENYRKRVQRQVSEAQSDAKLKTVSEFLTVYDHFRLAMDHADDNTDFQTLKQGMDMIYTEFSKAFENLGLEEIDAEGKTFDPELHEAVGQESSDEVPEGHVLKQWQKGYQLDDRLIRPAKVIVSAGSVAKDASEEASASNENESEAGEGCAKTEESANETETSGSSWNEE